MTSGFPTLRIGSSARPVASEAQISGLILRRPGWERLKSEVQNKQILS
jgi:hypothetical protein